MTAMTVQYNDDDADGVVEWDKPQAEQEVWSAEPLRTPKQLAKDWKEFKKAAIEGDFDAESLTEGVQKVYSTSRAAAFFGRSNQWLYWGLRTGIFTYKDGSPIEPERVGPIGKRRFTLPIIREIALSCYRRGNLSEDELQIIMERILLAEFGEKAFAQSE